MIDLYTAPTPNGWKASITLEELGCDYKVHAINIMAGEQKKPDYLKINPNGRIPAIVDDGFSVFESGAIMIYLAEKYDRLLPTGFQARSRTIQWLMFQMGGLGPMMGQANVFYRYFPEKIQPVIDRYQGESKRLFGVLDKQLEENEFLAGDYSIADIANYSWARIYEWSGVDIEPFPHLKRWIDQISDRPAVEAGLSVPIKLEMNNAAQEDKFKKGARSILETGKNK